MFEWFFGGYYVISLLYTAYLFKYHLRRRSYSLLVYELIMIILLPFVGFPMMVVTKWKKGQLGVDTGIHLLQAASEETMETLDRHVYRSVNVEKESNIVPLEEALIVNDLATRRRMLLDVLKEDSFQYINLLQEAVSNEDTETSHYAVSAIMEIKRKLLLRLQEWSVQYETNKNDFEVLVSYAEVLQQYMKSGFLDERSLRKNQYMYFEILTRLVEIYPQREDYHVERINCALGLGRYTEASRAGEALMAAHGDREIAYLMALKILYTTKSYDEFKVTLSKLKQSSIKIGHTTLQYIRFWSKGGEHEISG